MVCQNTYATLRLCFLIIDFRFFHKIWYYFAGIVTENFLCTSEQGRSLVLDELDKELEDRNLEFCRYADDCAPRTLMSEERIKDAA